MVFASAVPPVLVVYHLIAVPVAAKFATVAPEQNVCEAFPVGEEGLLIVTVTANLFVLSHPLTVCDA